MAKRSQRRPSRNERDQTSCIWGLISIFGFRHGRSGRKLLADRRQASKKPVGAHTITKTILPGPTEKPENGLVAEESKMNVADAVKASVKELMEEELFNEKGLTKQSDDSDLCMGQINSKNGHQIKKNHRRKIGRYHQSSDTAIYEIDAEEICLKLREFSKSPKQKPLDTLDLEIIMEELAQISQRNINCMKHEFYGNLDSQAGQAVAVEEKLVAAIKVFVEQRVNDREHFGREGKSCSSKEFMDAMHTLSSNKRLFLKLLQDPNSALVKLLQDPNSALVKHIQNIEAAQFKKDQCSGSLTGLKLSEEELINSKSDDFCGRKHRNFFRRRCKSLESFPSERDEDCPSSRKIEISKSGSAGSQHPDITSSISLQSQYKKVPNERNTSQFSFTEIKRKLRHAMGKEKHGISPDGLILKFSSKRQNGNTNVDRGSVMENFGWSSPNRNHFYSERFAKSPTVFKRGEQVGKSSDNGLKVVDEKRQYPRLGVSNIYIEARKHLSEMLNNGNVNEESMSQQLHKSLGRILSLPEYNSSPCCSPRKHGEDFFKTAKMRLSPLSIVKGNVNGLGQENDNSHSIPDRENCEIQPHSPDDRVQSLNTNIDIPCRGDQENSSEILSFTEYIIIPEVRSLSSKLLEIGDMAESMADEEEKTINISHNPSINTTQIDFQNRDVTEVDSEETSSQCLKNSHQGFKPDLFGEDHIPSSPTFSPMCSPENVGAKDSEYAINNMDRPSPISVLETSFTDDDVSPASTSQPVEKEIEPRQIHFDEESPASEEGICMRISLDDDESAFEYVEAVLLGSGLNWDDYLLRWLSLFEILDPFLFDEVELFSSRARHDQKLLFDCTNEVLKELCESYFGCFTPILSIAHNVRPVLKGMDLIQKVWGQVEWHLFQHAVPHSLDQLVKGDMTKCRKWLNLSSDIEFIGFDMGETIFDELVEDTVLNFVDGTTSDADFLTPQSKSATTEDSNEL